MSATLPVDTAVQLWPIQRLIPYARNPRKNDAVVDRMAASIREFGFKIPVLAVSRGFHTSPMPQRQSAQAAHMARAEPRWSKPPWSLDLKCP